MSEINRIDRVRAALLVIAQDLRAERKRHLELEMRPLHLNECHVQVDLFDFKELEEALGMDEHDLTELLELFLETTLSRRSLGFHGQVAGVLEGLLTVLDHGQIPTRLLRHGLMKESSDE